MAIASPKRILRIPSVCALRGRSRSAHYADIAAGLCTPPVPIGPRAVGHPEDEIAAINAARIAGKSDEEIRHLVAALLAARQRTTANEPSANDRQEAA